ncbi:MAG: hypothetical protein ACR2F2_03420 [Pyrinomonadaceae bacterium]
MKPLKYNPEIILSFTSVDRFIFRVSDIEELENIPDELKYRLAVCHIYLICKRPRLTLIPKSIKVTDDRIFFIVEYRLFGVVHIKEVSLSKKHFFDEEVRFEVSTYPHREILTYDDSENHISTTLIANYVHLFDGIPDEVKNLEVLYVGKGLKDSAKDRLEKHSTLQKILADINSNEPDYEVFALVYSFERPKKNLMAFTDTKPENAREKFEEFIRKAKSYNPTVNEQIAIIEATLISYFVTTKYNSHYVDFPNKEVKILDEIYEVDFAAVTVLIDN